jgi:methyltransferase
VIPTVDAVLAVGALVYLPMLVEARRAALNERVQRALGGIEPAGDVYAAMKAAYPLAFLIMMIEAALRGFPSGPVVAAGALVFIAAKTMKWWAILTLGARWTFRVIVRPGEPLVKEGPYRFLRHPNYVAVVGELVGVALICGAIVAGPIAVIGFGALMLKRIAVEERALRSL